MALTRALVGTALTLTLAACAGEQVVPSAGPDAAAPSPSSPAATAAPPPTPSGVDASSPEVLVTGLQVPWGLTFLPGGDALVTERDTARLLRVPAGGGEPVEVTRFDDVDSTGEGGLLGLAYGPDDLVYAYYTGRSDNRVVRFSLDDPEARETVVTGIPKGATHNGGRIVFGPDDALYVGTGDSGDRSLSQDDGSLGGKVLRVQPGGPAEVFSKGHRNVQGLAFDADGRLYAVEFGQNAFDEVNQVRAGSNGGWPEVEGADDGGGRFLAPITTWTTAEASPSGGAIVGDTLYVAALRGRRLWAVPLDGSGGAGEPQALLQGDFGRLRTAERAPDGALWLLTSNRDGRGDAVADDDRLLRLPPR